MNSSKIYIATAAFIAGMVCFESAHAIDFPSEPNLLASSDTGMNDDDNVTSKMQPAFSGSAESNAIVRLKADGIVVGQGVATNAGSWEITVEPLDDGLYDMTAEAEDSAGVISALSAALQIEIDTLPPNTPFLDLVGAHDSGRHNNDNITYVNTPLLSATTHDPNAATHLSADNFKYRIYDRLEESTETLLYDSFAQINDFTSLTQVFTTADLLNGASILGPLADGVHNLKLEVEDRAGNISHDFLLNVLIDTVAPTGTVKLHPKSDSGRQGDLTTNDSVPLLYGTTEANAIVRMALDIGDNPPNGIPAGMTVALPYDGDDTFPPSAPPSFVANYVLQTVLSLSRGEHTFTAFFRDVAGNETAANDAPELTIFMDSRDRD